MDSKGNPCSPERDSLGSFYPNKQTQFGNGRVCADGRVFLTGLFYVSTDDCKGAEQQQQQRRNSTAHAHARCRVESWKERFVASQKLACIALFEFAFDVHHHIFVAKSQRYTSICARTMAAENLQRAHNGGGRKTRCTCMFMRSALVVAYLERWKICKN